MPPLVYFFGKICYTVIMKYNYQALYNKNAEYLSAHPRRKRIILFYNKWVTYFFFAAYALLWVYGFFEESFTPRDFAKIFIIPVALLLVVTVLRLAIDRARPYSADGAGITPLKEKRGERNSFPSRHLACAAVIATVFLPYLPAVGILLYLLSVGLGYTRFASGWHYPSDLVVGFLLGVAVGVFVFIL